MGTQELPDNEKGMLRIAESPLYEVDDKLDGKTPTLRVTQEDVTSPIEFESSGRKNSVSESMIGFWETKMLRSESLKRIYSAAIGDDPNSLESDQPVTGPRSKPWRTALIRFGPLSGVFCMCKSDP